MDSVDQTSPLSDESSIRDVVERLSRKPGVIATILMESSSGSIIQKTGQLSSSRGSQVGDWSKSTSSVTALSEDTSSRQGDVGLQDLASMAYNLVKAAGSLVHGLDVEDEAKLLRLRTKKHELVIVPDSKYTFLVVHETRPA